MHTSVGQTSAGALSELEFGPTDCKVVLNPRHVYVPKVQTSFKAQVITLLTLPFLEDEQGANLLCPVQALGLYRAL